jgi:hypothetical protein
MAPGGLPISSIPTTNGTGSTNPQDFAYATNGTNFVLSDPTAQRIIEIRPTDGSFVGSFRTPPFGSFSPTSVIWDGTNYRVGDNSEEQLFTMAPGGLPISSISVAGFSSNPQDLTLHPTRGTIFVPDTTSAQIAEVTTQGQLVRQIDMRPLGSFSPTCAVFDAQGVLRVGDNSEEQLFKVSDAGIREVTYDLESIDVKGPEGLAFDTQARTFFVNDATQLWELCVHDRELAIIGTIDLSTNGITSAKDVAVNPSAGEIYVVDNSQKKVFVFQRRDLRDLDPAKILYITEGDADTEATLALTARGHTVLVHSITEPGVIANNLDPTITQVWIVNDHGVTGPELGATDLEALANWRQDTGRPDIVIDGTAWRSHTTCTEEAYLENVVASLESKGGGIYLGAGAEQSPTANPADGGGLVVASANQVLDRLGFDRLRGDYAVTDSSTLSARGDIFDRATVLVDAAALSGTGKTPTQAGVIAGRPAYFIDPAALVGPTIEVPSAPSGLQPNGETLNVAIDGVYSSQIGSAELPGKKVDLITTTITADTNPDAALGPFTIVPDQVISIDPATQTALPGGNAVYIVTLTNVYVHPATYQLSVSGFPTGYTATIAPSAILSPGQTAGVVLGVSVPPAAVTTSIPFTVGLTEVATITSTAGSFTVTRDRGSASATLQVEAAASVIPVTLTPASATSAGESVAFTVGATNPWTSAARLSFTLIGAASLTSSPPALPDAIVPAGGTIAVPFSIAPVADPNAYVLGVVVSAPDEPHLLPGSAQSVLTVVAPDQPPIARAGPDRVVAATSPSGAAVTLDGSGSFDPEGSSLTYRWTGSDGETLTGVAPAATLALGTTTFTLVVNDGLFDSAPSTVTIVVGDTTPPVIGPLPTIVVEQATRQGTAVTYSPVVSDGVDPNPTVTCSPASGFVFPLGDSTVACVARDASGNVSAASFVVRVVDTTPPALAQPADVSFSTMRTDGDFVSYATPGALDVCDANPSVVCTPASGSFFPVGRTTVTCTATDASGNVALRTFSVTVQTDDVPPVIAFAAPASGALVATRTSAVAIAYSDSEAGGTGVNTSTLAVLADGADVSAAFARTASSARAVLSLADGSHSLQATVADGAGNLSAVASVTFTVDTTPPVITLVSPTQPIVVEQTSRAGTPVALVATATDAIDPSPRLTSDAPAVFPLGSTVVHFTATDAAGNVSQLSVTVTVRDTTPPAIAGLSDVTVEQTSPNGTPASYPPITVTDVCDAAPSVVVVPPAGTVFPLGSTTVRVTATDASGNSSTATFNVIVRDTTPPALGPLGNIIVEQISRGGTTVTFVTPKATDLCDANPSVTCVPPSGSFFPLGTTVVTCTATDTSGNRSTGQFTVTVRDTVPPTIAPIANVVVEQQSRAGTAATYPTVSVSDICDASPTVTFQPPSGSTFPLGVTTVTVKATDASGNASSTTFTVTVRDTTPPTITKPADVVVEQTDRAGTVVTFAAPTATDICDASTAVTCVPASGSKFPLGVTTVTCTATDVSGNASTTTFNVTVRDTTPPVLTKPADVVVEQTDRAGTVVTFATPTATDICDASPAVTCVPASGSKFPLGATSVTCTATDASGNASTTTFNVTVRDTTPPVLTKPADVMIEQTDRAGTVVTFATPTATDICDASPSVMCVPASGSKFPLGTTTVTCTATDASGNASTTTFNVTVRDTTPPVLTKPANVAVEQQDRAGTVVTFATPTATDVCDASPSVTCVPASGSKFPLGATSVTCTATDASGNASVTSFTVTVRDTTPPVIQKPVDLVVEQISLAGTPVTFPPFVVTDVCDASPRVVASPASGSLFPLGTTTVTVTATDASGNASTATFVVTVRDTTPPAITKPADITVEQATHSGTAVTFAPTATDICDAHPSVVCVPASGTVFPLGANTITCTATDASGNSSQTTFKVIVKDTTPPTITKPADLTILRTSVPVPASDPEIAAWLLQFKATDVCDAAPTVHDDATSFPAGSTVVHFTATDASGNVATAQGTVTVQTTPITIQITSPSVGLITSQSVTVTYTTTGSPTSVTLAGTRTLSAASSPAGAGPTYTLQGDYSITATATGPQGSATASVTFSIDQTPPVVTIASPVAAPHAGQPYPQDMYLFPSDLPIPLSYTATDDDGITGGASVTTVTLDGLSLPLTKTSIAATDFTDAGLPVLGQHTLVVNGIDQAGNVASASVTFEIVLGGSVGTSAVFTDLGAVNVTSEPASGNAMLNFAFQISGQDIVNGNDASSLPAGYGTPGTLQNLALALSGDEGPANVQVWGGGNPTAATLVGAAPVAPALFDFTGGGPCIYDGNAQKPQGSTWTQATGASAGTASARTIEQIFAKVRAFAAPYESGTTTAPGPSNNVILISGTSQTDLKNLKIAAVSSSPTNPFFLIVHPGAAKLSNTVLTSSGVPFYGVVYVDLRDYAGNTVSESATAAKTALGTVNVQMMPQDLFKPTNASGSIYGLYLVDGPQALSDWSSCSGLINASQASRVVGTTGFRQNGSIVNPNNSNYVDTNNKTQVISVLQLASLQLGTQVSVLQLSSTVVTQTLGKFGITLTSDGMLVVDPESLSGPGNMVTAYFTLPSAGTGASPDPTYADVVQSTLVLTGLDTGLSTSEVKVSVLTASSQLVIQFQRSQLTSSGSIGTHFSLSGRFFSTTGPSFVAFDTVQ